MDAWKWYLWTLQEPNFPMFIFRKFRIFNFSKSDQLYTFPTRTPVHYISTMYQTQHFLGILFLIQAKSGFHYHMRLGTHEIIVFGYIKNKFAREFWFWYNLRHPCIKWNISRIFCFCCNQKVQLLYGCPRPFKPPTREASRPTQRGGLGGRSPPSEKTNWFFMAVQEVPGGDTTTS